MKGLQERPSRKAFKKGLQERPSQSKCHDESWYQLKTWVASMGHTSFFSWNQTSLRSEFVTRGPKSHELKSRPHAVLWLSKVYGIPAGMYVSQVWGTVYLSEGSRFGSQLQKRHLCSLRRILGVKNSTANWAVLRECGQEPLQFFWFRASIRFFKWHA